MYICFCIKDNMSVIIEFIFTDKNFIIMLSFELDNSFVDRYRDIQPNFGYNGMGLFTYHRTYSRIKPNGEKEVWFETVRRVVEGAYSLQKDHIQNNELGWNDAKAQKFGARDVQLIFEMKFLPPGRMLWALGTPIVHQKNRTSLVQLCFCFNDKPR